MAGLSNKISADIIAVKIGDTRINYTELTPYQQWDILITLLEENGFKIVLNFDKDVKES